jgi:uncharacterized protein DUF5320
MPRLDGTGPSGQGPYTGRGMGNCRGGFGCFGFRRFFSKKNTVASLEEEEKFLKEELSALQEEKESLKDQK